MKLQMSFGENLINLRKQKGWSQDDLADNLNLSRQAISKWENDTSKPDIDNIKKISKIFSVTIDDLLNNDVVKDKAVTLNIKKKEKKERTITIVKCMIIAVIILYIINVIFKFASLLIIVNGIQKYANLSNYHYVIKTYDENEIVEIEEGWFKDGVSKIIVEYNIGLKDEYKQVTYLDFANNFGMIENNGQKVQINIENYLKSHKDFEKGEQLYSTFSLEIKEKNFFYILKDCLDTTVKNNNEEVITLKIKNQIVGIKRNTMLPCFIYNYNIERSSYSIKYYKIELNSIENIEI